MDVTTAHNCRTPVIPPPQHSPTTLNNCPRSARVQTTPVSKTKNLRRRKNHSPEFAMGKRMNRFFNPFNAIATSHSNDTNSRLNFNKPPVPNPFSSPNKQLDRAHFRFGASATPRPPSCQQSPESKFVRSGRDQHSLQSNVQTQHGRIKEQHATSDPRLPISTSTSMLPPIRVKNSRMTSAQRMTLLRQQRLETLEKNQPRQAHALREFLGSCNTSGRKVTKDFIDLTAEPEPHQLVNIVDDEFVSDSDNESLLLSNHSDGSFLRVLNKGPRAASPSDGKENRLDVVDLSQDDHPTQSRLKKRPKPRQSASTPRPAHADQTNSKIIDRVQDPDKWKKVSKPLQSFEALKDTERARKDAKRDTVPKAIGSNPTRRATNFSAGSDCGCANYPEPQCIESGNHSRFDNLASNHTDLEKKELAVRLSSYRIERKMHVEPVKRSCLQNVTSSLTKRVHPPSGDGKGASNWKGTHENGGRKVQSHENEVLEVPVTNELDSTVRLDVKHRGFREEVQNIRLQPLTRNELYEVNSVTQGVRKNEPLAFIKNANIMLRGEDFACLRGCRWLNDEVMNSFMALINARNDKFHYGDDDTVMFDANRAGEDSGSRVASKPDASRSYRLLFTMSRPRAHAFNTFFFARLTQGDGYDYRGVRRWLSRAGKDIGKLDLVLVPINLCQFHWVLAVIDLRNCQFIYFDSTFGRDDNNALDTLKTWLTDEVNDKIGKDRADEMRISEWRIIVNPTYLPRQRDSGSCGIFALYMAEYLERGVQPDFESHHIQTLRQRTVLFLKRGELPN